MIAFIDDHRQAHGVEPICKVLPIALSTYHAHVAKRVDPSRLSARDRRDAALKEEVRRVFEANFRVYGVRKVWRQLQREGFDVARCTVARLMRAMGLEGIIRGKPIRTTVSDKAAPCPLDHVNRQFHAPAPNMLWVSDFTYVATWTGFVYVAFVIDTYARRIVGWRVSRTAHASFVLDALEQALHDRRPVQGSRLVHHSDRGSQYVSIRYTERLAEAGVEPSVGSVGDATTMLSPKPSTASTRPRSSIGVDHGAHARPSSSRRSNGSTGSTIAGCWNPSATSRRPKPRSATTPCWMSQPWPRDSNETASDKPGAVQSLVRSRRQHYHRKIAETLRERYPDVAEAQPEILAHHYAGADLRDAAIPYLKAAADKSMRRSANQEAIAHLTKAKESWTLCRRGLSASNRS